MSEDRDKCVYLHKDVEGVVRYVGSGSLQRANLTYANSNRGSHYSDFVMINGKLEVEIVDRNLTKDEAEEIERKFYDKHRNTILNCRRPNSEKRLTKEMFENYLYYDETSKSCLRWKIGFSNDIKVDSEAGSLSKSKGYYVVTLDNKNYLSHRIVLILHNMSVEGKVVDHIDRDRSNNKINNLRVVTQNENNKNLSLASNNTSGVQGVYFHKQNNMWVVTWYEGKKQKRKYFSILRYPSSDDAFEAAVVFRQQMVNLHYKF